MNWNGIFQSHILYKMVLEQLWNFRKTYCFLLKMQNQIMEKRISQLEMSITHQLAIDVEKEILTKLSRSHNSLFSFQIPIYQ